MTQLLLFKSARIPDECKQHYEATGKCMLCGYPIRHHVHLYNHLVRCHTVKVPEASETKPRPRAYQKLYWVWDSEVLKTWVKVTRATYLACKRDGFETAVSDPRTIGKSAIKRLIPKPAAA